MRSPALAFGAIGSFLACQIICPIAREKPRSASSHDSALTNVSGSDPCCGGTPSRPTNPPEDSNCCLFCCCGGAVLTPSIPLDHLTLAMILPLAWSVATDELEVDRSLPNLLLNPRPPASSLRTTVLLI